MTTTIRSNGSKWAGDSPDSIAKLLEVLEQEPLDPTFEDYGNFYTDERNPEGWGEQTRFFGNFFNLSHVFNITSDDEDVVRPLKFAIRRNQGRPDYQQARCARFGYSLKTGAD
ncbi:MAG: hypothetical protein M3P06_11650 [Acidobacteriota bacterium]|nr:hypothetical protein [Acidobacteriota bacterium]